MLYRNPSIPTYTTNRVALPRGRFASCNSLRLTGPGCAEIVASIPATRRRSATSVRSHSRSPCAHKSCGSRPATAQRRLTIGLIYCGARAVDGAKRGASCNVGPLLHSPNAATGSTSPSSSATILVSATGAGRRAWPGLVPAKAPPSGPEADRGCVGRRRARSRHGGPCGAKFKTSAENRCSIVATVRDLPQAPLAPEASAAR